MYNTAATTNYSYSVYGVTPANQLVLNGKIMLHRYSTGALSDAISSVSSRLVDQTDMFTNASNS